MASNTVFTKSLATAASANNIALSQSPAAAAFTLNGAAVAGGVATIDAATATNSAIGRRVIVTSAGDNSAINFIVTGTNASGSIITDTFPGTNTGAAQSNLDFVTVTKIFGSAAVTGAITVGTNGVGSSGWQTMNWANTSPMNISVAVELVSGSVNYTVEYTYDDPNNLMGGVTTPLALSLSSPTVLVAGSATKDGIFNFPLIALRVTINSGTGVLRTRIVQAGNG